MEILDHLKSRAGELLLNRQQPVERMRRGVSLRTAQRLALLFVLRNIDDAELLKAILADLRDSFDVPEVNAFVYAPKGLQGGASLDTYGYDIQLFGKNSLNWYFKPVDVVRADVKPYDLLIDLTTEPQVPMGYLLHQLPSSTVAGTNLTRMNECYDLLLDFGRDAEASDVWAQMKFYLSNLNLQ